MGVKKKDVGVTRRLPGFLTWVESDVDATELELLTVALFYLLDHSTLSDFFYFFFLDPVTNVEWSRAIKAASVIINTH